MMVPKPPDGSGGERPRLLVLGLGNVLCSDDGVGPAAVAGVAFGDRRTEQ